MAFTGEDREFGAGELLLEIPAGGGWGQRVSRPVPKVCRGLDLVRREAPRPREEQAHFGGQGRGALPGGFDGRVEQRAEDGGVGECGPVARGQVPAELPVERPRGILAVLPGQCAGDNAGQPRSRRRPGTAFAIRGFMSCVAPGRSNGANPQATPSLLMRSPSLNAHAAA